MKKYPRSHSTHHFPEIFLLTILTSRISFWTSFTIRSKRQMVMSSCLSMHVPSGMTYKRNYGNCLKPPSFLYMQHPWERRQLVKTMNVMEGFVMEHACLFGADHWFDRFT